VSASADDTPGQDTSRFSEIYVMNADGTDLRKLPIYVYPDAGFPAWSPDSKKIAFTEGSLGIYTINADGTDKTRVADNIYSSRHQWSPNGEIAFTGDTPSATEEIYKISADGTNRTRLTHDDAIEDQLSWSPDGERIAYYTGIPPLARTRLPYATSAACILSSSNSTGLL
jgi:Tol biopolymer transport system component